MLIYGGCFPNIDTCGGNRGFTPCAVKNDLGSGIHTYRNARDLNCRFYVVEATLLENKCMCFQDYDYAMRKGRCRLPLEDTRVARISCPLGISRVESRKEKFSKVFGHIINPLY